MKILPLSVISAFLVTLIACSSAPSNPGTNGAKASIDFIDTRFSDLSPSFQWAQRDDQTAEQEGVWIGVNIYAIDRNTVFLFGKIGPHSGYGRSVLLRSIDGGHEWLEVMTPVLGHSVSQMSFVQDGHGWALTLWTVEGPDQVTLFHTTDYGQTWAKLSDVPRWQWYGYPVRMQFEDDMNGQIDMMYDGGLPETNRVAFLTSIDGGTTWQETSSFPLGASTRDGRATAIASYYENSPAELHETSGQDGSNWKVEEGEEGTISVIRRLNTESVWSIQCTFPQHLQYVQGHITVP